jgi:hypothetical protein
MHASGRPLRTWALASLALLLLTVAAGASLAAWRHRPQGQAMRISGGDREVTAPLPRPARPLQLHPSGPPFISSVSPAGNYFLDQYGEPILVKGDSPWALMTKLSPAQAESWFADRRRQGFNAAIVSLIGAEANGGAHADGRTFDGLAPFRDDDILRWQEPYWDRVTTYLRMAARHGITVMLFPVDGWTIDTSFKPTSIEQCRSYGVKVAQLLHGLPNIVWMSGGDYFPATEDLAKGSDVDHCIDAVMRGIRSTGDPRPFSMEMGFFESISSSNPFWEKRIGWNFVYTYYPTYRAVLRAYAHRPRIPAVLGESNYERENNVTGSPPTTDETLRRQVLWALTSGAAGDFFGSDDWEFHPGWQERLSTPAVTQIRRLRDLFARMPWWQLVPDTRDHLVITGRGTRLVGDEAVDVLQNDYVTAARTPSGRLAVVYVPSRRTITVDRGSLASGVRATWVDPASGARHAVPMSDRFTTPGPNQGGDTDWLLVLSTRPLPPS